MPGWVKLHRQYKNNFLWRERRIFSHWEAFEDLFTEANHANNTILFEGKSLLIKRGERLTSQRELAKRWLWSRGKVERFLKLLQQNGMIVVRNVERKASMITICNYDVYQGERGTNEPPTEPQTGLKQECKNVKNDKNIYIPEVEEIFILWNNQNIRNHREVTTGILKAVSSCIKIWGIEAIERAIVNYGKIISSPEEYWFTYRWTLEQFLTRKNAIREFVDDICLTNYRRSNGHDKNNFKSDHGRSPSRRGGYLQFRRFQRNNSHLRGIFQKSCGWNNIKTLIISSNG